MGMGKTIFESPEALSTDLNAESIERFKVLFPVDKLCAGLLVVRKKAEGLLEDILGGRN